jgi:2'-5' RNA ligase
MTARTPIASTVPEPHGKPGGPGAFRIKGAMYPPYIQHVAGDLIPKYGESRAYRMAIGIVRNWAEGHDGHGHKVSAQVQAAATKAIAAYDALRARAKATPNKGGKDLAALVNGRDGEVRAVDSPAELQAAQRRSGQPDIAPDSAMVALYPPSAAAKKIAVPNGLEPGDLHVTLAYLGKGLNSKQKRCARAVVQSVAAQHAALSGSIGGAGQFPAGDDGVPHYAPVDVPGLAEFRTHLVQQLQAADVPVSTDHGFTPHMTRTYGGKPPAPVKPVDAAFPHVHLVIGPTKHAFPLAGKNPRSTMPNADLSIWDSTKHPRGQKGTSNGGRFVPVGKARDSAAAQAQKSKTGRTTYTHEIVASSQVQQARLKRLSDQQLAALTREAYSFKSSDSSVVRLRLAVAAEMAHRGYDVKDFGAQGGGINSDKKLPPAAARKTKTNSRKRRSAARSKAATSKAKAISMSNSQTDQTAAKKFVAQLPDALAAKDLSSAKFDALATKVGSKNLAGWITQHNPKVHARATAKKRLKAALKVKLKSAASKKLAAKKAAE